MLYTWSVIVQGYLINFDLGADHHCDVEDLGSVTTEARLPHLRPPAPLFINVEYQRCEGALTNAFDCPSILISILRKRSSKRPMSTITQPTVFFNFDISCPFAYIASTRIKALAERTNARLIYRPVLLGAIYRATAAPQGAAGSASDVFNPTKKAVAAQSMQRTLKR